MINNDLILKTEQLKTFMTREQVENHLYSLGYDYLEISTATDFVYKTHSPVKGSLKIGFVVIWLFVVGTILSWGLAL